ncbi:acyl--CoA ligase [Pacificimonas sp. WHA3]|uniref:Acyl--CoA ligase n=1 Tax=Pacificimonas pallii TaxID=2827236 RepID=A0ABS6SBB1_9SPHN|nr:class I adenylate-forming enzyme family protein [Pacificimonas pallii]MBV7255702.1 acyl--CoA ligase [Pacificimonas pallii]
MSDLIRDHAARRGERIAVRMDDDALTYAEFDRQVDRVAAALQREGVGMGEAVSVCAATSVRYAALYMGVLRAGGAVAPIAPGVTGAQMAAMIADSGARLAFLDAGTRATLADHADGLTAGFVAMDGSDVGTDWADWIAPADAVPAPVTISPDGPFNIIYSSGTTGVPKGIVHSNTMRWRQMGAGGKAGYDEAVIINSTPLYSNTTLVTFLPTLAWGGTVVLMKKFDARRFLELAEATRATHTMLVPVQYRRIMADPDFDRFDLSAFRFKTCTSAPFAAELKADVVARWPGKLVEYYGLTEGGCSFVLICDEHPDKLHTVGVPLPGHEVKLLGEDGREVAPGEPGEIVGRSGTMMNGYLNRDDKTSEMIWHDENGDAWFRQGDIGRLDEDGFLILTDRKKDMIISGGFNIFPSDIEAVARGCDGVEDISVVGVPSEQWGETPIAFAVGAATPDAIKTYTNERVGKTQRLSDVVMVDELPRSAIGKVLKRELREKYLAA